MTPRPPSSLLVVDSNIVLSAALGARACPVFERIVPHRPLLLSARIHAEVIDVGSAPRIGGQQTRHLVDLLCSLVQIIDASLDEGKLSRAASVLRQAPASRNGSTTEDLVLALAWTADADIRSHDREFAGTGSPSWSSANLIAAVDGDRVDWVVPFVSLSVFMSNPRPRRPLPGP